MFKLVSQATKVVIIRENALFYVFFVSQIALFYMFWAFQIALFCMYNKKRCAKHLAHLLII